MTDPLTNVDCAGKGAEVGIEALGAAGGWYGEDMGNWPLLKYVFEQFKVVISNHRSLFKTIFFQNSILKPILLSIIYDMIACKEKERVLASPSCVPLRLCSLLFPIMPTCCARRYASPLSMQTFIP